MGMLCGFLLTSPCCNLSGGVALIVWFTTNGMCVKNNTIMYVARTSNNRVIPMEWSWWVTSNNACEPGEQLIVLANGDDESDLSSGDHCCCLLPRCEALHTCRSGFPIATPAPLGRTWYLSHHRTSVLTKFRVVFDCLAKFNGVSLNDQLLPGPV